MTYQNKEHTLIKLFIKAFYIFSFIMIFAVSYGEDRNIPEFTAGIVDGTDFDLTGHIIIITDRGRYYPMPDFYCDSLEMLVYEAVVIHPSGGIITSLEIGSPAIYLNEALIPRLEIWPGTRLEVVYVTDCNARGFSYDSGQMILELKKY